MDTTQIITAGTNHSNSSNNDSSFISTKDGYLPIPNGLLHPDDISFDFSTWGTSFCLFSKADAMHTSKLYESHILRSNAVFLEELINLYSPSLKSIVDMFTFSFNNKRQINLFAAKVAYYDLENNLYKTNSDGKTESISSLYRRLDKQKFVLDYISFIKQSYNK